MPTARKQKVFLTRAQRVAMKEEVRIAMEYPYKSHARGAAITEIAERYNVSKTVVHKMVRTTRPARSETTAAAEPTTKPTETPAAATAYELTIGDVTITAGSKVAMLGVLDKLIVTKGQ